MKKEYEHFIIEYDANINYIDDLILMLEQEMNRIMDFFKLTKLSEKKKIKIWNNRLEYRSYLEQYVPQYYDWMIADTFDGNINMLSLEECRKTDSHSDITMQFFMQSIVHEFVHSCQQEINPNAENVEWFWEALATNLSNQYNDIIDIDYSKEQLMYEFNSLDNNYKMAYTIGRYMLETLTHEKILGYVKNPKTIQEDIEDIMNNTKIWLQQKIK